MTRIYRRVRPDPYGNIEVYIRGWLYISWQSRLRDTPVAFPARRGATIHLLHARKSTKGGTAGPFVTGASAPGLTISRRLSICLRLRHPAEFQFPISPAIFDRHGQLAGSKAEIVSD